MIFGAGHLDRVIANPEQLLMRYRQDTGAYYLDYESIIPRDRIVPEDLAVTLLVNSQVRWYAFRSIQLYGSSIDLALLPDKPLEQTTEEERQRIAEMIAVVAHWPGFAAS